MMKKYSKLAAVIAALLMVTAIVVTFEACKKEKLAGNIGSKTTNGLAYQQNVSDRETYIIDFKKKYLSGSKSDEVMSVDNANAFLFDLLNYDFCKLNVGYSDVSYETTDYTINIKEKNNNVPYGTQPLSHYMIVYYAVIAYSQHDPLL